MVMFYTHMPHPTAYMLWTLYHGDLRFVTNLKALLVLWTCWMVVLVFKYSWTLADSNLRGYFWSPSDLCQTEEDITTFSHSTFFCSVPKIRTELRKKKAFKFAAPFTEYELQKDLKLTSWFHRTLLSGCWMTFFIFIFLQWLLMFTNICCCCLFRVF